MTLHKELQHTLHFTKAPQLFFHQPYHHMTWMALHKSLQYTLHPCWQTWWIKELRLLYTHWLRNNTVDYHCLSFPRCILHLLIPFEIQLFLFWCIWPLSKKIKPVSSFHASVYYGWFMLEHSVHHSIYLIVSSKVDVYIMYYNKWYFKVWLSLVFCPFLELWLVMTICSQDKSETPMNWSLVRYTGINYCYVLITAWY